MGKIMEKGIYETTLEGEMGEEYDLRIHYYGWPAERPDYEDGYMVYPGCEGGLEIESYERLDTMGWQEWDDATDQQEIEWTAEIEEAELKYYMENMQ